MDAGRQESAVLQGTRICILGLSVRACNFDVSYHRSSMNLSSLFSYSEHGMEVPLYGLMYSIAVLQLS